VVVEEAVGMVLSLAGEADVPCPLPLTSSFSSPETSGGENHS
jgi:hypothetical protein